MWEERALLDHYLAIQKIRFGDRLRIEMNIPPELKYAVVPSLFLQPLIENAIRRSLSPRAGGVLEWKVRDQGTSFPLHLMEEESDRAQA